jgi:hypothetical protein
MWALFTISLSGKPSISVRFDGKNPSPRQPRTIATFQTNLEADDLLNDIEHYPHIFSSGARCTGREYVWKYKH